MVGFVGEIKDIQAAGKSIFVGIEHVEFMKLLFVQLGDDLLALLIIFFLNDELLLKINIHK